MYEINGKEYSLEQLQSAAKVHAMDFDSYMDVMKKKGLVKKTEDVAVQDAPVTSQTTTASENTESKSESTLLELPGFESTNHEFKPYELLQPNTQDGTSIENVSTDIFNLQQHEEKKQEALEVYKEKDELAEDKPIITVSPITEKKTKQWGGLASVEVDAEGDNTTYKNINRKTIYNPSGEDEVVYNYTDSEDIVTQEDIDIFEANLYKSNIQAKVKELSDGRLLTEEEKNEIEKDPLAFINDFDASLSVVNNMYRDYKTDWSLLEDRTSGITPSGIEFFVEESDLDVNKFLNRKQKNQNEAYEDWAASYNIEFNNNFRKRYENEINTINSNVQQSYAKKLQIELDAFQQSLLTNFQQRQQAGEFENMSQEEVQQLFANEVNAKQQQLATLYSDQANKELNKFILARYDDYTVANEKEFRRRQIEFFQNYIPPMDLIGKEKYEDLTKQFRVNGWDTANNETKKLMLDNAWTNIEIGLKEAGITDETEILNRKTEYYHKYWNDMVYDVKGDMSRFGIDETSKDLLTTINQELERVNSILSFREDGMATMIGEIGESYGPYTKEQYDQAVKEFYLLTDAKDKLEFAISRPEEMSDTGFSKFFQGILGLESKLDYIPIVGGIINTVEAYDAYKLFKKKERGEELTPAEKTVISAFAVKNLSDNKFAELTKGQTAYNSGQQLAQMFPWVAEIFLTKGVFTGAKKLAQRKIDDVLMSSIDDMFTEQGKKTIRANVSDGLAVVVGAGAQSAIIPTNYLDSTFERMTPQVKMMITSEGDDIMGQLAVNGGYALDEEGNYDVEAFDKAFAKAFGINFSEYFTERLGAGFGPLAKFIRRDALGNPEWLRRSIIARGFKQLGITNKSQAITYIQKGIGYDGFFGEIAEEIINIPIQNLIEGNKLFEGLDSQFLKETGLTIGVMQVMFSTPGTVSKIIKGKHNNVYRMDGENYSSLSELQEEYNYRKSQGENPLVYIKNDAKGAVSMYRAMVEQDGNADALQYENTRLTFTDLKTANEIKAIESLDAESRKEVESLEEKIESVENELTDVKKSSMLPVNEKITTKDKLDRELQELQNKRQEILAPIIKKQAKEQSKTTTQNVQDLAEVMFGEQVDIKEVTNENLVKIFGKEADGSFGSIKKEKDAEGNEKTTIYINSAKKTTREGVNVSSHEFLHLVLRATIDNNPSTAYALGNSLLNMLGNIQPFDTGSIPRLMARINVYRDPNADKMIPLTSPKQAEEVLTIVADAIATGQITYNRNTFEKIGAMFSRVFRNIGIPYKFNNAMDVFNFLEDYSKGVQNGTLNEAIRIGAIDGFKVSGEVAEVDQIFRDLMAQEDGDENAERFEAESKDASDSVQRLYDTTGVDSAFEIFQLFKPITTRIANRYREVPGFDLEMMISEIEVGQRGIYDLIRDYDPNSGVPLAAYINKYLPSRAIEAANRILKTEFEEDVTEARGVAAEEATEVKAPERRIKLINVSEKLGVESEVLTEVETAGIDPKLILSFKKVPNAALQTVSNLTGIPVKKLKNLANLSKGELASMQMFVRKNAGLLIDMLPQGFDSEGKATGVPKTLLDAFYNKRSSRARTKAGLKTQVKKTNILESEFLEVFGIVEGIADRTDRNTSARALALANLLGKIMTNQALRAIDPSAAQIADGMSDVLFSKDVSDSITYMAPTWSKITASMGATPLDIRGKDRGAYINWLATVAAKVLPRSFFTGGNLYAAGAENSNVKDANGNQLYIDAEGNITLEETKKKLKEYTLLDGRKVRNNNPNFDSYRLSFKPASAKYAFANKDQFEAAMEGVEFAPESSNITAMAKVSVKYGKFTAEQAQNWLNNNQDLLDQSDQGFKEVWSILQDLIKDPSNVAFVAAMLESSAVNQGHFMRTGARYGFHNTLGLENVEEHTQPATEFAKILFTLSKMGVVDQYIDNAMKAYIQGALPKIYDKLLKKTGEFNYIAQIPKEWQFKVFTGEVPVWIRYFNPDVNTNSGGINPNFIVLANGNTIAQEYGVEINSSLYNNVDIVSMQQDLLFKIFSGQITQEQAKKSITEYVSKYPVKTKTARQKKLENASKAFQAMSRDAKPRGMSTFDFDETLIIDGENFIVATNPQTGEQVRISSGDWPLQGPRFAEQGYEFDFTDFVNVRGGVDGPLLQKMRNQIKKYGPKNVFILTARPQESATAIHEWLKTKGINIPFENITGLGNSTGDAKAAWFLEKYAEGYNDMYFVDDALPNVEAVKHVFDQLDIKGKSVQVRFSKDVNIEFNNMLERTKGVGAEKRFSEVEARKRGKNIGGFTFFVPPSAEDFTGLLRYFVGKGEQGNADIKFFEEYLIKPFARADREMSSMKQSIRDQYKALRKQFPNIRKKLGKLSPVRGFTFDGAIRVYLFNKAGYEIPGLAKNAQQELIRLVQSDPELRAFADGVGAISKRTEGYIKPEEGWDMGNIAADLQSVTDKISRKQFLQEWVENKDMIFSPENLNKIEATYGTNFRSALEDILYRMETGQNRRKGRTSFENKWNNWINSSVGAIMFFNARSAVLQTLSTVNFINFEDNNIFAAARAFANQKQYWSDFALLFNSDFLKNRRAGLATNVNEAELASAVAGAKNKALAALRYLLKIGFTPTQVADSFAIASGGATFYRNRVKKYIKEGRSQQEAEDQAMLDFREIAEETQQSARPDRISQQQASNLGRIILAFANTPMQYNRLIKKAAGDLINGRGDWRSNISRIVYYGAIQNFIFASLQNALFALAFDDSEEDDERKEVKESRILNSMLDSLLRGSGIAGAVLATVKNALIEYADQDAKGWRADYGQVIIEALQVSPPLGSKARKLFQASQVRKFNQGLFSRMDLLDYDNPTWEAMGYVVEATTNIPMARAIRKIDNLREAMNQENTNLQRLMLALGWSSWDLGVGEKVIRNEGQKDEYTVTLDTKRMAREEVKQEIAEEKKQVTIKKREQRELEKEKEKEALEQENLKKQKKEGKEATCAAITSSGNRCKRKPGSSGYCTIHEKVEKRSDGKEVQCSHIKSNKKRCKMKTTNKSGLCYYHD